MYLQYTIYLARFKEERSVSLTFNFQGVGKGYDEYQRVFYFFLSAIDK